MTWTAGTPRATTRRLKPLASLVFVGAFGLAAFGSAYPAFAGEKFFAGSDKSGAQGAQGAQGAFNRQRTTSSGRFFAGEHQAATPKPKTQTQAKRKAKKPAVAAKPEAAPENETASNRIVLPKDAKLQAMQKPKKRLLFIDEEPTPAHPVPVANAPLPSPRPVGPMKAATVKTRIAKSRAKIDPVKTASVGGCMRPERTNDRDIRRNAKVLAGACVKKHIVQDGRRRWVIYQIGNGGAPHYPILHDDENAAFSGAARVTRGKRGTIWAVEAGERRFFKGQDPNRNFGSGKCRNQRGSNGAFSRFFSQKMRRGKIIAVHSNANSFAGGGGRGNISIRRKSTILQGFPARNAKGGFRDEDNFILVPGRSAKPSGRALAKIRAYNGRGINAMYEYVRGGGDCSLSNYLVLKGQAGRYANVEVQDGQTAMAVRLIRSAR
ncbi:MAG: hypothetical protein AAGM04_07625 [Pseudomonadota bacterium]